MNAQQMLALIERHGLTLEWSGGAGKFRDLIIGTGAAYAALEQLRKEVIEAHGCANMVKITHVTNPEHPQHGQAYLEVASFWWEEVPA